MTTNFGEWTWCHCWVPLHGAIVMCYGGGRGSGAIAGCHCSVPWWGESFLLSGVYAGIFFFNDFNDGKYPRYYENNATTFWVHFP